MVELLFAVGIFVSIFVGFNIGGSSTGVAFGPAVGSELVSKLTAAGLMTSFALLGAWTAGRQVIQTIVFCRLSVTYLEYIWSPCFDVDDGCRCNCGVGPCE